MAQLIGDPRPALDECWKGTGTITMNGTNVGDLLELKNISWGWFQGGFRHRLHSTHHEPFHYFAQTANPAHLPPACDEIGHAGRANQQYDLTIFWAAADVHRLPAVSYLKA